MNGPLTSRDGYVDVDRGVVDSIHDIKDVLRHTKPFVVVDSPERATIVLVVLGRRMASDARSMILPIGAMAIAVPMHSRAIDLLLRAGTYERPITTTDKNDNTWGNTAKLVVRDVKAWAPANATALAS